MFNFHRSLTLNREPELLLKNTTQLHYSYKAVKSRKNIYILEEILMEQKLRVLHWKYFRFRE